jgi:hypothetical protein
MIARRNPDGDSPLWRRLLVEADCAVKRRLAPRAQPVALTAAHAQPELAKEGGDDMAMQPDGAGGTGLPFSAATLMRGGRGA